MSTGAFSARADADVTYKEVAPSERDPAVRVPFPTTHEFAGITEDIFFHTTVEDDGLEGAFGMRGNVAPIAPKNVD